MTTTPTTSRAKQAAPPAKKTPNVIAELDREQATLRTEINRSRDRLHGLQQELASSLALQRGAAKHRAPLVEALSAAQRAGQDAQEALTRHIGQETESIYADKLFDANEAVRLAQEALAAFDQQFVTKDRAQELRTDAQREEEALQQLEQRQSALTHELDQAVTIQRKHALSRILSAYQDLYTVLESDGQALDRMRRDDIVGYTRLMRDLSIDETDLLGMIHVDEYDDRRFVLRERQQALRDRLAKLKNQ